MDKKKKWNHRKSAFTEIEETGGKEGAFYVSVKDFAEIVNTDFPAFSIKYIIKCAEDVMSGKYDSISPSYGTDVFDIVKIGNDVIATSQPNRKSNLWKYKLIA
jgi:hypothetical protein